MLEEFDTLKKDVQDYIEIRIDLIRLHIAENMSRILVTTVNTAVVGYFLFFILLFLSLAGGFFLSTLLNSYILGFLALSVFYLLLLVLYILLRKKIVEKPIIKAITKLFFAKFDKDE